MLGCVRSHLMSLAPQKRLTIFGKVQGLGGLVARFNIDRAFGLGGEVILGLKIIELDEIN